MARERTVTFSGPTSRFRWGVADQIFSSLTNFALTAMVARAVSQMEFGAFTLVFATYVLALGASRAIACEPLTVRYSAVEPRLWRQGAESAAGTALIVGLAVGLACLLVATGTHGVLSDSFLSLSIAMPGLLVQDCWRFAFFAQGRGEKAFLNDLFWAVALFPTLLTLLAVGRTSPGLIILTWGAAGTLAAIFGGIQGSLLPKIQRTLGWKREQDDLIPAYLVEFATSTGASQLVIYAAGLVSLEAAGTLRAGQILLGPFMVLLMGVRLTALPGAVKIAKRSPELLPGTVGRLTVVLAAGAIAWATLPLLIPRSIGTAVLGASWDSGRTVVLPLGVVSAASALIMGAVVGLRALVSTRRSLRARLLTAPLLVGAGSAGATVGAGLGAAIGLALATSLAAGLWWREFLRGVDDNVRARREPRYRDAL